MREQTKTENSVVYFRVGGHNHDGENSTKIDLSNYTLDEINELRAALGVLSRTEIFSGIPNLPNGVNVGGIFIGPGSEIPAPTGADTPNTPSGLRLTTGVSIVPGSNTIQSYIDVTWGEAESGGVGTSEVTDYEVEIIKTGEGIMQAPVRTQSLSHRFQPVEPGQEYGIRVRAINRLNQSSIFLPSTGYEYITAAVDTTIPATVTGVDLSCGFQTATLIWNDNTEDDVSNGRGTYHIQLADISDFSNIVYDKLVNGTITSFSNLISGGTTYYARVKAIDTSGNESIAWSTVDSDTTGFVTIDDAFIEMGGVNALLNSSFEIDGTTEESAELTYLEELQADSVAGYWPLNETSGTTANDASGNGRNGTYNGSPSFVSTGPEGTRAVDFPNNSATYVQIADDSVFSSSSFTIHAWVNPDVVNSEMTWLSKFPNADPGAEWNFWMGAGPGNPYVDVHNTVGGAPFLRYTGANNTVVAGTWQMMTMKMDGSTNTVSLYRNGVFVGSSNTTTGTRHGDNTAPLIIGKRGLTADPRPMDGRIAHVSYIPSAISDARILAHFEAMVPPSVTGPDGIPDDWATSGTNTLALDTGTKFDRNKAAKITYSNDLTLLSQTVTLPTPGLYTFSAWVYIPSAWSGGAISVTHDSTFAGATTVTSTNQSTTTEDEWVRIWVIYDLVEGDLTGSFKIKAASATATQFIFVDAVQLEYGNILTAYAPRPAEIYPGSITETSIADDAVTTPKIITGAVIADTIASNAVTTVKLAAEAVTAAKIQAGTITADRIAADTITASQIAASTITASEIAANTITANKLAVTQALDAHTVTLSSTGLLRAGSGTRAATEYQTLVTGRSSIKSYYKLSENSSSTAVDSGPNALNGTYAGTYTQQHTGALSNDSTNKSTVFGDGGTNAGQVTVADNANLDFTSAFTIECWVERTNQKSDWQTLVVKENSSGIVRNYGLFIYANSWTILASVANTTYDDLSSTANVLVSGWNHIVYTYDGTFYRLYINGALNAVKQRSVTPPNSTGSLYIGTSSGGLYTKGNAIDEVALYNAALTDTQIQEQYNAGKNSFQYVVLDTNGLRFYTQGSSAFTGGNLVADLATTTGSATFRGAINASTITGGLITGAYISGSTLVGTTIKTAETGQRIELTTTEIKRYNATGSIDFKVSNSETFITIPGINTGGSSINFGAGLRLSAGDTFTIADGSGNGFMAMYNNAGAVTTWWGDPVLNAQLIWDDIFNKFIFTKALAVNEPIEGTAGSGGVELMDRGYDNVISFDWDGADLYLYIDGVSQGKFDRS